MRILFITLLLRIWAGPALAQYVAAPMKVFIDGENIDPVPQGQVKPPCAIGATVWPTGIATNLSGRTPGGAQGIATAGRVTGISATVNAKVGRYWAELDLFSLDQLTEAPFIFGGVTLLPGAVLKQSDVVLRTSREISRYETNFGHYRLDLGLRTTSASRTVSQAGLELIGSHFIISPEISVWGRWIVDGGMGIHARLSYATSTTGAKSETALEGLVAADYHWLRTHSYQSDVSVGYRFLAVKLGFPDELTGSDSTFENLYAGPELSLTQRF